MVALHNLCIVQVGRTNFSGMSCVRISKFKIFISDCPPNWIAGVDSCYSLEISNIRARRVAAQFCDRMDSHLAIIETAQENHFLSDILMSTTQGGILLLI